MLLLLCQEAEFLDEIQTKPLRVFFFAIQKTSTALPSLNLYFISALLYTVKVKGGKPDRKPHPLPYGLRNPYRNLKSGEFSRLCPETSKKLYVHKFGLSLPVSVHCNMRAKFVEREEDLDFLLSLE
jgi:hypothetical protein